MKVYKFGGASVSSPENLVNVANIILNAQNGNLIVVVSATGKTTNKLEAILNLSRKGKDYSSEINELRKIHQHYLDNLEELEGFQEEMDGIFKMLEESLSKYKDHEYDFAYDQIVPFGEIISSKLLHTYLAKMVPVSWIDARMLIKTDHTYREAVVDWEESNKSIQNTIINQDQKLFITQGFIGSDENGNTTTLGREGSDFTAAIFSYCLDAESMSIWKDVPGILTADPKLFDNTAKIDRISYREAIEMTYYGAKVIHPKTIKPLQNKGIPLWVKSFTKPEEIGTLISGEIELTYPPVVVIESNQALLHFSTRDFSFVGEEHLSRLFKIFDDFRIRINMMRNTAISFSICTRFIPSRIDLLIDEVQKDFNVAADYDLELITIRHYTEGLVNNMKKGKLVLFEERLKQTIQMVVKDIPEMVRKS